MDNDTKMYFVIPDKGTGVEGFLVSVWAWSGSQAGASVFQRHTWRRFNADGTIDESNPKRSDFDDHTEVSMGKDWDGSMRMIVETDGSSPGPETVGFYLQVCEFLCDRAMAEAEAAFGHDTLEYCLSRCSDGEGAVENPGITYEEFKEN